MTTNPQLIKDAMWHRGALDLKHVDGAPVDAPSVKAQAMNRAPPDTPSRPALNRAPLTAPSRPAQGFNSWGSNRLVTLDDVMLHSNRVLRDADGFERDHYMKEMMTEEGGPSGARRDSLGSPSDLERPNMLDSIMQHQNRILHHSEGFLRDDYLKEKSSMTRTPFDDSEGSSIFS